MDNQKLDSGEEGATLVEAALTAPIFFFLLLGILDLSLTLAQHFELRSAAYFEARKLAMTPCEPIDQALVKSRIENRANLIFPRLVLHSAYARVNWNPGLGTTTTDGLPLIFGLFEIEVQGEINTFLLKMMSFGYISSINIEKIFAVPVEVGCE